MEVFRIKGSKPLTGSVSVSGSKNSSLPLFAASLLSSEETILENVPQLSDIKFMAEIISELGAKVERLDSNTWKIKEVNFREVQGKWTQKVFQVDDSPRYEGSASWVHVDGKHFWENTVDAPLPRRERTIRSDYNVMKRMNRVEITDYGWSHKQDNEKIVRKDNESDFILAKEYGHNTYVKVDNNQCRYAKQWWDANKIKWKTVRLVWEDIFNSNPELKLKKKVEEKPLWQFLFSDDYKSEQEIRNIINKFVL